jgi:hypothetical protein
MRREREREREKMRAYRVEAKAAGRPNDLKSRMQMSYDE